MHLRSTSILIAYLLITFHFRASLVDAQADGPQNVVEIGPSGQPVFKAPTLPDVSAYGPLTTLATSGGGNYSMGFRVEDGQQSVRFLVMYNNGSQQLGQAWIGIGFGKSMLIADFIITHIYPNDTVQMHEHKHRFQYAPPWAGENPEEWVFTPLNGGYLNGTLFGEFRMPLVPPARPVAHRTLSLGANGDPQPMIWAYNPDSSTNDWGGYFAYHNPNPGSGTGLPSQRDQTHGAMMINFVRGTVEPIPINPLNPKIAHGAGMFIAWLVIFPFGAYYSRYMRFIPKWIYVHLFTQVIGFILVIIFFIVILSTIVLYNNAHPILGTIMIGILCVQLFGGLGNRTFLRTDLPATRRRDFVRRLHRLTGFGLILAAIAQVTLGLRILYPPEEPRGKAFWVVFYCVVAFWALLFATTQAVRRIFFVIKDRPSRAATQEGGKYMEAGQSVPRGVTELAKLQDNRLYPHLVSYDWDTLDKAICDGKLLVVANGRYVYDTSKWVLSHPGGQIILYAVAGTDITSDYFHEAGYDAAEFTPAPPVPKQNLNRTDISRIHRELSTSSASPISPTSEQMDMAAASATPALSERDWSRIIRARRPHVHTKLAIMRLAHLLVGELNPTLSKEESESTLYGGARRSSVGSRRFDPAEYRRYAMTEKTLVTYPTYGAHSNPIWRLRFCLLYPFELRDGQSESFEPGQAVEIQVRIEGKAMSRYYSAISGNLTAFEILVKHYPNNGVSTFLCKSRPGDRQYKIRGPFGDSLVAKHRPLGFIGGDDNGWVPDSLLYIAAGAGITPFLQLLQYLFLPTNVPIKVNGDYLPVVPDELLVHRGDLVVIRHHYLDGWALGYNMTTGEEGVFPLPKTVPRHGPYSKLVLLNCVASPGDVVGMDLIDGVLLAYPHQLEVHHAITMGEQDVKNVSGFVYGGHVCEPIIREAVRGATRTALHDEGNGSYQLHQKANKGKLRKWAIVCGPPSFNGTVMDELIYKFGYDATEVTVLRSDSPDWYTRETSS